MGVQRNRLGSSVRKVARGLLGVSLWLALAALAAWLVAGRPGGESFLAELVAHARRRSLELTARFDGHALVEIGDDVRLASSDGEVIGEVSALLDADGRPLGAKLARVETARLRIFDADRHPPREGAQGQLLRVPDLAGPWILDQFLTAENVERIREIWRERGLLQHRREILELSAPILRELIVDLEATVEEEARPFLVRHRPRIDAIIAKVETQMGPGSLRSLFESEVWPNIRSHLTPLLDEIGGEIWERVPLWSFTWRIVYQSLPLTDDDHFRRRWNHFVETEVIPILRSHADEVVEICRDVARDTLSNARVVSYAREALLRFATDPELHRLAHDFTKEVFFENPRFRERLRARWEAAETQAFVDFVSAKLEPVMREIGDVLFGTRETGISDELARVLRTQILEKDRREIRLELGPDGAPLLAPGAVVKVEESAETP